MARQGRQASLYATRADCALAQVADRWLELAQRWSGCRICSRSPGVCLDTCTQASKFNREQNRVDAIHCRQESRAVPYRRRLPLCRWLCQVGAQTVRIVRRAPTVPRARGSDQLLPHRSKCAGVHCRPADPHHLPQLPADSEPALRTEG